ncbi:hypothetical protein A9F13_04g02266 [Clavispora lusitaniae]|uniref:Uncharacterized protein n=1 Tax=Clavispora lusitaniae TaxID=36911 RepID=A0AA91Q2J0_CLALS|nr:hypothetical protein A9F13_04g02266 [Clavispora lusitaniae]
MATGCSVLSARRTTLGSEPSRTASHVKKETSHSQQCRVEVRSAAKESVLEVRREGGGLNS